MSTVSIEMVRLLRPSEVAERLGVKEGTLAIWRWRGVSDLPFIKAGGVRYREEDVLAFIEKRRRTRTPCIPKPNVSAVQKKRPRARVGVAVAGVQ
jgi:predicted site-specific integrase-resolvase